MMRQTPNTRVGFVSLLWCTALTWLAGSAGAAPGPVQPSDPDATTHARALLSGLQAIRGEKVLFGHHMTSFFTVTDPPPGRSRWSDVRAATGDWPGLWSFDMNFATEWFQAEHVREEIRYAWQTGGLATMSWHIFNPVTGGNFRDDEIEIASILPGGANHHLLVEKLSEGADFLETVTDAQGRPIPILFRPWHEFNLRSAFWWNKATPEQFADLYRFTVEYFRDARDLHQLLWVYNPHYQALKNAEDLQAAYLEGYPGDDYVDLMTLDKYGDVTVPGLPAALSAMVQLADARGKVPSFHETGVWPHYADPAADPDWYADLLAMLDHDQHTRTLPYVMTWFNKPDQYWVPYAEGLNGYDAFLQFHADDRTGFGGDFHRLTLPTDLNRDGAVDAGDIDAIFAHFAAESLESVFDLEGDGDVDDRDVDLYLANVLNTRRGDANLDQIVDVIDLAVLGLHFDESDRGWAEGDFDGNGVINVIDLGMLGSNFGRNPPLQEVPEPTTALLLTLTALAGLRRRPALRGSPAVRPDRSRKMS